MNCISQYNFKTESMELYLTGCFGICKGCHNPELANFKNGLLLDRERLESIIDKCNNNLVKNVMLMGGDPLDQDYEELNVLLEILKKRVGKPIWVWTRFELEEVPKFVKDKCDFIKCGRYIEVLKTDKNVCLGIPLSTSNQKIHIKGVDY